MSRAVIVVCIVVGVLEAIGISIGHLGPVALLVKYFLRGIV